MSINKELIEKLTKLSDLYTHIIELKNAMDNFEPEDNYERQIIVPTFPNEDVADKLKNAVNHEDENAVKKNGSCI